MKGRAHRRTDLASAVLLACFLLALPTPQAQGATAGTVVPNTAVANWTISGVPLTASDTVTFVVAPSGVLPPDDIALAGAVIPAGVPGAPIGTITISDPDAGDTHTVTVDDPRFQVVGGELRLAPGVILGLGDGPITITLTATDSFGLTYSEPFTLDVLPQAIPSTPLKCAAPDLRNGADVAAADFAVCENSPGAAVVQLLALPDGVGAVFDDPRFLLDSDGVVRLAPDAAFDFETEAALSVTLTLEQGGATVDTRTLDIVIGDRNEAPTLDVAPTFTVLEGAAGVSFGPVTIADPDAGDTLTTAVDDGRFEIVGGVLRLRDGVSLDRADVPDGAAGVPVTVSVTDAGGLVTTRVVTVVVDPVNQAPVAENIDIGVALGTATGTQITRVLGSDPDATDVLDFEIVGGNGAGAFSIDPDGAVRVANPAALGADGDVFELRVRVRDDNGGRDPAGRLATEVVVRITVTGSNTPPFVVDQTFDPLAENGGAGTLVGVVGALDIHDDPLTFVITGGDPDGAFSIDARTGELRVARPELIDFEARQSFELEVSVTDSFDVPLTSAARITVPVLDVNEPPLIDPATFTIPATALLGDFVGDLVFSDPDVIAGDSATVTIVAGNEAGAFELDPVTGTIKVTNLALLGDLREVQLRVAATDRNASNSPGGPLTTEAIVTIRIDDVNAAPTAISLDGGLVEADVPGAVVGRLATTDPDVDDTHIYSLSDPRFVVVDGELRLAPGVSLPDGVQVALTVTATDPFGLSVTRTFQVGTTLAGRNPAIIDFLKSPLGTQREGGISLSAVSGIGALNLVDFDLAQPQCSTGPSMDGPFVDTPTPRSLGNFALPVPGIVGLQIADLYKVGEPMFLRVTDRDPNRDPNVRETVVITLSVDASRDVEILRLVESGPDTSEFVGYIQSTSRANDNYDCVLWVADSVEIVASYFDSEDGTDTAAAAALVDPFGIVFDSATGRRVDGALVRLLNVDTGQPAEVFGDEPFAPYPSEMRSGEAVRDEAGVLYTFDPGEYRFPLIDPGNYRFEVFPPNRFRFPSEASDGQIAGLPDGPYVIDTGSRGETFEVPIGPALRIDIPLDVTELDPTPATVELLRLGEGPEASIVTVGLTQCTNGAPAALPTAADGAVIGIPAQLSLEPVEIMSAGDDVFLRVTDLDEDRDPFAPDEIELEIAVEGGAEVERVRLRETGASTGVFTGYVGTTDATPTAGDCALGVASDDALLARYVDANDAEDTAEDRVLVDPSSRVFDAITGELVDGVRVTVVDAATGLPAAPLSSDGVSAFPSTVETGAVVQDAAGNRFEFAPGSFRFPTLPPGEYRFELVPPEGFVFPSIVPDDQLDGLPGAPFRLSTGSRGESFTVAAGDFVVLDIPIDPAAAEIFLSKRALDDIVAIGDFIQYRITAENAGAAAAGGITLVDTQPPGFRYQKGSLRVAGERVEDARIDEDGRTLRVDLTGLVLGSRIDVTYVAEVTAGAELGEAINRVTAIGPRVASANTAEASVVVREDLLRSQAILIGRVFEGSCDTPADERRGLAGARVFLEDGTNVVADANGRWHIEGVEPGTHVVQLDLESLPASHRVIRCEDNTRFAGTAFSQFVDVQGGSVWRADFHVALRPPVEEEIVTRLEALVNGDRVLLALEASGREVPLSRLMLIAMLPEGLVYEPGSARRGGRAIDDPAGASGRNLTFRLGDTTGAFDERITFAARMSEELAQGRSEIRSVAMFGTPTERRVRSELAVTILDVDAPVPMPAGTDVQLPVDVPGAEQRLARMLDAAAAEAIDYRIEVDGEPPAWLVSLATQADVTLHTRPLLGGVGSADIAAAPAPATASTQGASTEAGPVAPHRLVRLVRGDAVRGARRVALLQSDSGEIRTRAVGDIPGLGEETGGYVMRTLPDQTMPEWTTENVGRAADGPEVLWPAPDHLPRITSTWFVVRHGIGDRVQLTLNGEPVSPFNFDGREKFEASATAISVWRGIEIEEGQNVFEARVSGTDGSERTIVRDVYFSGPAVRGVYVPEASTLVADGVNPPEIAIRLFDRSGARVRPGMTGGFSVQSPYAPFDPRREEVNIADDRRDERNTYVVHDDGIAYIPLEPTARAGEVRIDIDFGPRYGRDEFFARLQPAERNWIVVGFGEGTVGYETLSENMVAARESGFDDGTRTDGRVALFAKGMIQGKWLLTMAYDSDKRDVGRFGQQVDPNRFYTLYGDGSQQQFEAESRRKLYLKIERGAFNALFGDFDTRLGDAQLTRFSRRLTGVRAEYADQDYELLLFGAETETAFVRDELRGDGTSGLYRLSSQRLLDNSERITIETRDRFHDDQIIETRQLARFTDYNIDYDAGTVLFREPIQAQDVDLNPIFIVAEYETEGDGDDRRDLIVGARAERRFDRGEVAASFVHDGTRGTEASLGGVDARWQPDERTEVRAEAAWSRGKGGEGDTTDGLAYLVEAERRGETVTTRGYYREQEADFGVGQQSVSQGGTRRFGLEMQARLDNDVSVDSEAYQQHNLESGATRNVLEAEGRWQKGNTQLSLGGRMVDEELSDGATERTNQITGRIQQALFGNRVRVSASGDHALGGTTSRDFPTRVGLGAEFDLLKQFTLLATQEMTFADERDTQDTFFGARSQPWDGAQVDAGVKQQFGENAERTFATVGLTQAFQLSEALRVDFGFNREQTIRDALAQPAGQSQPNDRDSDGEDGDLLVQDPLGILPATPPASGAAPNSDFTSGFVGGAYRQENWEATARLEHRHADTEDATNVRFGFARQLDEGRIWSLTMNLLSRDTANEDSYTGDIRAALAWRPQEGAWTFLNRLDLVANQRKGNGIDFAERKLVNNFAANFKPNARNQLALLFGAKYVLDEIDDERYSSVTTLLGGEYRYDMTRRWDLGLHGSVLSSWNSSVHDIAAGLSIGHSPMRNVWVSLGYNFVGFVDEDFTAADYTAQGPFVKFRFKVDQAAIEEYLGDLPFTFD